MKILFLTNLLPYPLDNGGKIKTYTTLRALKNADNEIDLVCFTETEDSQKNEVGLADICNEIHQIPLKLTTALNKRYMLKVAICSLFSKYSFGVYKYISGELNGLLEELGNCKKYDCIYFDHLQMFLYFNKTRKLWRQAITVLDEHNCEYLIMQRNFEKSRNLVKKAFLCFETVKLKRFEKYALKEVDKVIVLSEQDQGVLQGLTNKSFDSTIIPIGIMGASERHSPKRGYLNTINVLFVGTLSWAPNNDGLVWFMENVFPRISEKYSDLTMYIVGKNPGEKLKEICKQYSNVVVTGYVDSVAPYYSMCDLMVVPLFIGSGQRVKIIEGFSYGMPTISTSIGAEGLEYVDGENILIADDSERFVEQFEKMQDEDVRCRLNRESIKTFDESYSLKAIEKKISIFIESIHSD